MPKASSIRGSYAPSILNILQFTGWATFESIMAQAAYLLSERFLDGSSYLVWVVFFGAITTLMAMAGPVFVIKQWLEKFAVWAVLLSMLWLTYALVMSYDLTTLFVDFGIYNPTCSV